jgi:hypothetical protein
MPLTQLYTGTFVSDGKEKSIKLPGDADRFKLTNRSALAAGVASGFEWSWSPSLASGEAKQKSKDAADVVSEALLTSGGFVYRKSRPEPEAAVPVVDVTPFDPAAVFTTVDHGYATGDRIRVYDTTDMRQIAGMDFTIEVTSSTAFALKNLDTSDFAGPSSGGFVRRLPSLGEVVPESLFVTKVTQAAQAVVTMSVDHTYQVGQLLTLSVPATFGMSELDGVTAKVVARDDATVTLDVDSSSFTPFAFPASSPLPQGFATIAPAGQRNAYDVEDVPFHTGQFYPYMHLGPALVGSAGEEYEWEAWKGEN